VLISLWVKVEKDPNVWNDFIWLEHVLRNFFFTVLKHAENNNGCIKLGLHTSLLMPFNLTTIIITMVDSKNISKHVRIKQTLSVLSFFFKSCKCDYTSEFFMYMGHALQLTIFKNLCKLYKACQFAKFLVSHFFPTGNDLWTMVIRVSTIILGSSHVGGNTLYADANDSWLLVLLFLVVVMLNCSTHSVH
jgi:hypothetical protein